jgi:polyhydroxybutyrate depolymerase
MFIQFQRSLVPMVAVASIACGTDPTGELEVDDDAVRAAGVQVTTRSFQGRSYRVFKPRAARRRSLPIIVMLHGKGGGDLNAQSGMGDRAGEGFIAVFPQNSEDRSWNDGQARNDDGIDDVQFILDILADVHAQDGGDLGRAFASGMSNGSVMTQRLACDVPDRFLAFAPVSGLKPADYPCRTRHRSPIAFFHGTADTAMPWEGGSLMDESPVLSATESFHFWSTKNGCQRERVVNLPDTTDDGTTVEKHVFATCGEQTIQYEIVGGGHTWAGPPPSRPQDGLDSQDIDATTEILTFFRSHGM